MNNVEKTNLINGKKIWESSITVPIEMIGDDYFLNHIKSQLKERCVKEYVDNAEDSFRYNIYTDRVSREAKISITLEDIFGLKESNNKLHRECKELVSKYIAIRNRLEQLK